MTRIVRLLTVSVSTLFAIDCSSIADNTSLPWLGSRASNKLKTARSYNYLFWPTLSGAIYIFFLLRAVFN